MNGKRTMSGVADLTGEIIGTLTIEAMVSRYPSPKYACRCKLCGTKQTLGQREIVIGKAACRASGCGREAIRAAAELTPRKFAQQEARLQRDRIDALASEVKDKADKIARLQRDRLLKGVDADFPFDPQTSDLSMSAEEAQGFNALNAKRFAAANPWYYPTKQNLELIAGYLDRHGVVLVSAKQLELVARRLFEYGLLETRPVVEPKPEPYVNLSIEQPPEQPKRREPEMGWDLQTGQERLYSPYEIDRLNSDQYRRAFRLYGDKMPTFPTRAAF